jgi:predicted RNase H-like HicB family nuclease
MACRSRGAVRECDERVNRTIDLDLEEDSRWIAEALELPGAMCYGQSRDEAIANAGRLAIEVIADRIAHNELPSSAFGVSFTISPMSNWPVSKPRRVAALEASAGE